MVQFKFRSDRSAQLRIESIFGFVRFGFGFSGLSVSTRRRRFLNVFLMALQNQIEISFSGFRIFLNVACIFLLMALAQNIHCPRVRDSIPRSPTTPFAFSGLLTVFSFFFSETRRAEKKKVYFILFLFFSLILFKFFFGFSPLPPSHQRPSPFFFFC